MKSGYFLNGDRVYPGCKRTTVSQDEQDGEELLALEKATAQNSRKVQKIALVHAGLAFLALASSKG